MKSTENIYLECRKKAAEYNEKLNSREAAAELLGVSVSTLANYELGITKKHTTRQYCDDERPIPDA